MKACFAVSLVLSVAVCGPVYAQLGPPNCVSCGGSPTIPVCSSGWYSGFEVCWVSASGCYAQNSCFYAGGGGCFVAGTVVETVAGQVAIEDLNIGDRVLGRSDDGVVVFNQVLDTFRTLTVEYFVINGEISVTGTHPFLVHGTWVEAKDIRVGDTLVGEDGNAVQVYSIDPVNYGVRVYNITVAGNHTFFADGILVHNKTPVPE